MSNQNKTLDVFSSLLCFQKSFLNGLKSQSAFLYSYMQCIHVNKSGRKRSSTEGLDPTDIRLNLAGFVFILEKKTYQPQVFTAEPQTFTFHETYMCT